MSLQSNGIDEKGSGDAPWHMTALLFFVKGGWRIYTKLIESTVGTATWMPILHPSGLKED